MKKKETTWFSHEANTHSLPEILAMMDKHHTVSYAWYWILMEILRVEEDFKFDISKSYAYRTLARLMDTDEATVKQWLADCIDEFGLFDRDEQYIWSPALCARLEMMEEKRAVASENGKRGAAIRNSKRLATLDNIDSQAEATLKPNSAHNITQQNNTEHNNTPHNATEQNNNNNTTQNERNSINNSSSSFVFKEWDIIKQRALEDKNFVEPYTSSGKITEQQLAAWLDAFNRRLEFEAAPPKTEQEYRKHFANWFKYHDPIRENPENQSPTPPNKVLQDPNRPQTFMRNVHELIAEQELRRQQQDEADRIEQEHQRRLAEGLDPDEDY